MKVWDRIWRAVWPEDTADFVGIGVKREAVGIVDADGRIPSGVMTPARIMQEAIKRGAASATDDMGKMRTEFVDTMGWVSPPQTRHLPKSWFPPPPHRASADPHTRQMEEYLRAVGYGE